MLANQFNNLPILAGSYQFRYQKLGRLKMKLSQVLGSFYVIGQVYSSLCPFYKGAGSLDWTLGLCMSTRYRYTTQSQKRKLIIYLFYLQTIIITHFSSLHTKTMYRQNLNHFLFYCRTKAERILCYYIQFSYMNKIRVLCVRCLEM